MANSFLYPATPANVPASVTEPSPAFKKEVSRVMGSIFFFFIVYALLLLLSVALIIGCVYAGIAIIVNVPRLITIFAGIGLIGVGVMVFIFLVKFMFSVSRYDRSNIIEITEAEQPALFGFIRQLTQDTQTRFPRRIYLSADVNACVFYDSSFWSMFFPVKKNLQIGLGLVNSLNLSEFKAVMAHEFGHFSQRSMKLGSFVYNVNKIIYNMLYENSGYASFLQGWASIDGVFAIFASITAGIARFIQAILKGMYSLINKRYMGLSRQMEFHADAVAASVSGSKSLDTALRRIEMASSCYDITLQKCDELFKQNKISGNIYTGQKQVFKVMAGQHKLPMQNGLPVISDEFYKNNNNSRVNFKDQWASHPATEDRIRHLEQLAIPAEICDEPAWVLFENKEQLQEQLTRKVYEAVVLPQDVVTVNEDEFSRQLQQEQQEFTFPEAYNGYYDNRQPAIPDTDGLEALPDPATRFDTLFTAEHAALNKKISGASRDLAVLKAIAEKQVNVKTFDFDGVKHKRSEAPAVMAKLEAELKEMQQELEQLDTEAVRYFLQKARQSPEPAYTGLRSQYEEYIALRKEADAYLNQMNDMLKVLSPVFSGQTMQIEQINPMIKNLKDNHEPGFKEKLRYWIGKGVFAGKPELTKKAEDFIAAEYVYFNVTAFFEPELQTLHSLCTESWAELNNYLFMRFKKILEFQLTLKDQ